MERHIEWTSPAPLWSDLGDPSLASMRRAFRTPALFRFTKDEFMDDFHSLLAAAPERLREFVAAPESWSQPPGEPAAPQIAVTGLRRRLVRARARAVARLEARGTRTFALLPNPNEIRPLKLYQPAHGRFYLLSACLVCREAGLPDRHVDTTAEEKVSFVVRLLRPGAGAAPVNPDPASCTELAFVNGAWQPLADPQILVPAEQRHPLSAACYRELDGRRRRLFTALVPVTLRDRFAAAVQPSAGGTFPAPIDPRQMRLKTALFEPWQKLEALALAAQAAAADQSGGEIPTPAQIQNAVNLANTQTQAGSFYMLLDFGDWLEKYMKPVWEAIANGGTTGAGPQDDILNTLDTISNSGTSFRAALKLARASKIQLESVKTRFSETSSDWPAFRFRFTTATLAGATGLTPPLPRDSFEALIMAALPAQSSVPLPPPSAASLASVTPQNPADWFAIRCALERPNCPGLAMPVLSDPTPSFQLAAFFDPDAPARPIRIGMPVDTTAAGLRKFGKNTAFIMSDTLCGQVKKMQSLSFGDLIRQVLPFPLHKDLDAGDMSPCESSPGVALGMVCSFSIPIITICALILLLIIVKLLDIIFFWIPFFQICLPLPKLSAKGSS